MQQGKERLNEINKFLYNPINFQDITKKDGLFSVIYSVGLISSFTLLVMFTNAKQIYVVGSIFSISFCLIAFILNKKKIHALGITKNKLKETLILFGIIFALALLLNLKKISTNEVTIYDFFYNMFSTLISIGFAEEFIFRGYLWPRLVILFGKHKGSLICGMLFG
ncbi:membrane protease YdiL (CAAX protease family) [Aequitasia blattaphilus]|uniref:CPBP family intramembrane metalloprotease n=1 Tax=Aequitasia blattaphilus TaxID=2949332 RepID=A0ABT1EE05_9FIRM|nr:CPBP family intramembrane glutamic endopeptidase [Aequitasia blattaphilus]MCP1103172.1 CPBP family intramembrane metalloprotease [Aequitasia blattaphilus]MCR8615812.1 CPBP family intramembrane metalloprotease [Aequitasia blattaphilus]